MKLDKAALKNTGWVVLGDCELTSGDVPLHTYRESYAFWKHAPNLDQAEFQGDIVIIWTICSLSELKAAFDRAGGKTLFEFRVLEDGRVQLGSQGDHKGEGMIFDSVDAVWEHYDRIFTIEISL